MFLITFWMEQTPREGRRPMELRIFFKNIDFCLCGGNPAIFPFLDHYMRLKFIRKLFLLFRSNSSWFPLNYYCRTINLSIFGIFHGSDTCYFSCIQSTVRNIFVFSNLLLHNQNNWWLGLGHPKWLLETCFIIPIPIIASFDCVIPN